MRNFVNFQKFNTLNEANIGKIKYDSINLKLFKINIILRH